MDWLSLALAITGSPIVWEFLIKPFIPDRAYFFLIKYGQRFRLNRKDCEVWVLKTYEVKESLESEILRNKIKSRISAVFGSNARIIESMHNYVIDVSFSNRNISMNIEIEPEGEYENEICRIVITQYTRTKFSNLRRDLNDMLWNLNKIFTNMTDLLSFVEGVNVKVKMEDVNLFTEVLDQIGTNSLTTPRVSISRENRGTIISIEDEMDPVIIEKIRNILLLGYLIPSYSRMSSG